MTTCLRRRLWIDAFWLAGSAALVAALVAGPLVRLQNRKDEVRSSAAEVERQQAVIAALPPSTQARRRTERIEAELARWAALTGGESARMAALSTAARAAGLRIVSLESLAPRTDSESGVATCAHRVTALGDCRQLAEFLDAIQASGGALAVTSLAVQVEDDAAPGALSASLEVTWFATLPRTDGPEAGGAG